MIYINDYEIFCKSLMVSIPITYIVLGIIDIIKILIKILIENRGENE